MPCAKLGATREEARETRAMNDLEKNITLAWWYKSTAEGMRRDADDGYN